MSDHRKDYTFLLPKIRAYIEGHNCGPSLIEVAGFLGNGSTSHAAYALRQLEAKGYIQRFKRKGRYIPRAIMIIKEEDNGD